MTNKYIKKLVVILSTPAHTQYLSTYSVLEYILSIPVSIIESSAAVAIPSADDPFDDDDVDNTNYDDNDNTHTSNQH